MVMRLRSWLNAVVKAAPLLLVRTLHRGGIFARPNAPIIGWPGQTGQTSPAALSQTVNTKSSVGAPGAANSSQLLLRRPSVG